MDAHLNTKAEIGRLMKELGEHPGRLGLVTDGKNGEHLVAQVAELIAETPVSVGGVVVEDFPITQDSIQGRLSESSILVDLEVLFEPKLQIDPLLLLRNLARRRPRVALWPGRISAGVATYSEFGRRDWYEARLENAIVLRPLTSRFPDEAPYTVERIA